MIDSELLASLQTRFHEQWLVPRAIDAAADALRRWYATHPQPLALDTLALYPHSLALDLTDPAAPHVITRVDVGVPLLPGDCFGDFLDVGTFWLETRLDGQVFNETVKIDCDQAHVDWWFDDEDRPPPSYVPTYPVNAHGSTPARTILHQLSPSAAIPDQLVADLAGALDIAARERDAHPSGHQTIANCFEEYPAELRGRTPGMVALRTAYMQLVFPLNSDRQILLRVVLDVLGMPAEGGELQPLGEYQHWTRLDGTYDDDYYTLEEYSRQILPAPPPAPGVPADLLRDLGHLNEKRQATLGRLVEAVGVDGFRRLLAEARTRLAELALSDPAPTAPKSMRGMLWHMLQHDALDPATRARVLGLTTSRRTRR